MFDNSASGTEAMMTLYKEGLLDKDYASVKVLGLYVMPPYPIFTTGKKIQSVRDFRGLRMRTPSTTVGGALAKLGAVPLGVPLNMIGDTIASGYVDSIAYGWDSTTTTRGAGGQFLIDQLSVAIDARLAAPTLMIVMNRAKWDAMPDDLKKIIEKHGSSLAWKAPGFARRRKPWPGKNCRTTRTSLCSRSPTISAPRCSVSPRLRSPNGKPIWPSSASTVSASTSAPKN